MKLVLDADVLIGALDDSDSQHRRAHGLFVRWEREKAPRLISVVNLSEVLVAPSADAALLRTAREAIGALGVTVHRPSEAIGIDAARLRLAYPISLPDAYCLATARHTDGQLVSFDRKVIHAAEAEQIAYESAPRRT